MITMKRGDTAPDLSITVTDNGTPVDLSTATVVEVIAAMNGNRRFTRTVTGTALGVVTMPWQTTDTAVAGMLEVEIQVTWPGTTAPVQTFPADGRLRVNIEPDIDAPGTTTSLPLSAYGLTEDPTHPGLYLIGT